MLLKGAIKNSTWFDTNHQPTRMHQQTGVTWHHADHKDNPHCRLSATPLLIEGAAKWSLSTATTSRFLSSIAPALKTSESESLQCKLHMHTAPMMKLFIFYSRSTVCRRKSGGLRKWKLVRRKKNGVRQISLRIICIYSEMGNNLSIDRKYDVVDN